jgi:hypothetical protein
VKTFTLSSRSTWKAKRYVLLEGKYYLAAEALKRAHSILRFIPSLQEIDVENGRSIIEDYMGVKYDIEDSGWKIREASTLGYDNELEEWAEEHWHLLG